jgi:uncharacterized BrkB/YihY/UPF0761 family membrane protein
MTEMPEKRSLRERGAAARTRGLELRDQLEGQRPLHASVDVGFRWLLRDKDIAGGVLGGGLAYRFFFWILALSVLLAGGLGFASASGADVVGDARNVGIAKSLASTIATASKESETGRWWLLVTGLFLFAWFSFGLLRALRLVSAAAWRVPLPPLRNAPKGLIVVAASPLVVLALTALAGWIREHSARPLGVLATILLGALFGGVWLWISMKLPAAPGTTWTAFIPGAVVFAVGVEALHLFSVYYLQTKLENANELYGVLGLATTALFYFFLIGRGVVWSAELNAVVWEARTGLPRPETQV